MTSSSAILPTNNRLTPHVLYPQNRTSVFRTKEFEKLLKGAGGYPGLSEEAVKAASKKAHVSTNKQLHATAFDDTLSGTTAISVLLKVTTTANPLTAMCFLLSKKFVVDLIYISSSVHFSVTSHELRVNVSRGFRRTSNRAKYIPVSKRKPRVTRIQREGVIQRKCAPNT